MEPDTILWVVIGILTMAVCAQSWYIRKCEREGILDAQKYAEKAMEKRVYHREAIGHYTRVKRLEAYILALGGKVPPVLNDEILGTIPEDMAEKDPARLVPLAERLMTGGKP